MQTFNGKCSTFVCCCMTLRLNAIKILKKLVIQNGLRKRWALRMCVVCACVCDYSLCFSKYEQRLEGDLGDKPTLCCRCDQSGEEKEMCVNRRNGWLTEMHPKKRRCYHVFAFASSSSFFLSCSRLFVHISRAHRRNWPRAVPLYIKRPLFWLIRFCSCVARDAGPIHLMQIIERNFSRCEAIDKWHNSDL